MRISEIVLQGIRNIKRVSLNHDQKYTKSYYIQYRLNLFTKRSTYIDANLPVG